MTMRCRKIPRRIGATGLARALLVIMARLFSWLGAIRSETGPKLIIASFDGTGVRFVLCWRLAHRNESTQRDI
jgi:hypothetical protein